MKTRHLKFWQQLIPLIIRGKDVPQINFILPKSVFAKKYRDCSALSLPILTPLGVGKISIVLK